MPRLILLLDALFILGVMWIVANLVHFVANMKSTAATSGFFALSNALRKAKGEPK